MTAKASSSVASLVEEGLAGELPSPDADCLRRAARVIDSASSDMALVVHAHMELLSSVIGREEAMEILGKIALGFGTGMLVDSDPERTDLAALVDRARNAARTA